MVTMWFCVGRVYCLERLLNSFKITHKISCSNILGSLSLNFFVTIGNPSSYHLLGEIIFLMMIVLEIVILFK